jgi:hypothetical protein
MAVARGTGLRRYAAFVTGLISFIGFLRETPPAAATWRSSAPPRKSGPP